LISAVANPDPAGRDYSPLTTGRKGGKGRGSLHPSLKPHPAFSALLASIYAFQFFFTYNSNPGYCILYRPT